MIASPGLIIKALSKIQEPYKFNIDPYNLEQVQSFRKTVLSSLMALPHHESLENIWVLMKDTPECDTDTKNKIQKYLYDKFKEKFSITWGSVSTVVDNSLINDLRYDVTRADFIYLTDSLALACEKSSRFAEVSFAILSIDYT